MSDLLNSASLVMIPSGYKEDVVYSQIPTDGSGDLSFTRASNGTRINSAGLVEDVPWNLFTYSEEFNNAIWVKIAGVTANATTAPNGTTTADKITESAVTNFQNIFQAITQNVAQFTYSIYLKKSQNDRCVLFAGSSQALLWIDMTNWTSFAQTNVNSYSIDAVGDGWYRVAFSYTNTTSGNHQTGINLVQIGTTNTVNYAGSTSNGAFIWGAQLNIGSTAKPYFPTTDRLNVPRLTYQNGGGGCPSLLLEKQSTNSAFPSEDFSGYSGSAATVVTNQATSPDGTTNADLIYPATNGNFAGKYINIANSTTGVVSCFVKQASKRYAIIGTDNNSTYTCIFDLQTATVVYQATNYTGKIESVGNGWYRISAVYTSSTAAAYPFIGVADNSSGGVVVDGTNGLYIWGFQYELNSSYPTSYIPTTSSSATRVADECRKGSISSLIGQTEGSLYGEMLVNPSGESLLMWVRNSTAGLYGNFIYLGTNSNGEARLQVVNSAIVQAEIVGSGALSIGWHKFAVGYKLNDFVFYVDGVQIGTSSSGSVPSSMNELFLDQYIDGGIRNASKKEVVLFPTRLTNTQLQQLTA